MVWRGYYWLGDNITNNYAEYCGLVEGLKAAVNLGVTRLEVRGDSELAIKQMLGDYKVRKANLLPLYTSACELVSQIADCTFVHIPRSENADADALANKAISTSRSESIIDS